MSESYEERRKRMPWLPPLSELRRVPPPVPELGWCARCKRVNPRPGYPDELEGHDWVVGMDQYAYIAGVICPDCLSSEEASAVLESRVFDDTMVEFGDGMVSFDGAIFINPEDAKDVEP